MRFRQAALPARERPDAPGPRYATVRDVVPSRRIGSSNRGGIMAAERDRWTELRSHWLALTGLRAIFLLAIAGVIALGLYLYSLTAGFVTPLLIATILGMLFSPVVAALQKARVPRSLGAVIVMLGLGAAGTATVFVTARGIISQWDEISLQIRAGVTALEDWIAGLSISPDVIARAQETVGNSISRLATGIGTAVGSGLVSTAAFLFGTFLGAFMLFYILTDWENIREWVGGHIALPTDLGEEVVEDAVSAMRQYFTGVTISSLIVAVVIGIGLWLLDVPLVFAIMLVTFLTGYIPYFGAIISSVFAFLIALSSGGVPVALTVLLVILVAQNVIQTIVTNQIASDKLSIHPLVGLLATLGGGVFLGLLGGILGTPLAALSIRAVARIKAYKQAAAAAVPAD